MIGWIRKWIEERSAPTDPEARLVFNILLDLGYSRKSAKLRAEAWETLSALERSGVDWIVEVRKRLQALTLDLSLPIPKLPEFELPKFELPIDLPPWRKK